MTATRVAIILGLLMSGLAQAQNPEPPTPAAAYFPIAVGNTWTYKAGESRVIMKIAQMEKINNRDSARMVVIINGKEISSENIAVVGAEVQRLAIEKTVLNPPVTFLKSPGEKGRWTVKTELKVDEKKQVVEGDFVTSAPEAVKVLEVDYPKTVLVTSDKMKANGVEMSIKYWFAEKVGMVKQELKLAGNTIVFELEKFEAGAAPMK